METTYDRMNKLEAKVDKILEYFNPTETSDTNVSELIEKKFEELTKSIENKAQTSPTTHAQSVAEEIDEQQLKDFNRSRTTWFLGALLVSLMATGVFIYFKNLLFLIPGGIAMAFIGLLFLIFVDWKGTPGDSYAKISRNPIAVAIFMLIVTIYFGIGIFVAQQYIPDSFSGEASQRIDERLNNIENIINQGKEESQEQVPETSETDDEQIGNGRIPNR